MKCSKKCKSEAVESSAKSIKVEIVAHYVKNDEGMEGDYAAISVAVNGVKAAEYGDDYHDKGAEKVEGFVDALNFVYGEGNVKTAYSEKADWTF